MTKRPITKKDILFIDTETTGLNPFLHKVWEIGIVNIQGEVVYHCVGPVVLDKHTDLKALEINNYVSRVQNLSKHPLWFHHIRKVYDICQGKVLCGSAVQFDMRFLEHMMWNCWTDENAIRSYGMGPHPPAPTWHHQPLEIGAYVAGKLNLDVPLKLSECAEAVDIDVNEYDRHTAVDDARLVRDVYLHFNS